MGTSGDVAITEGSGSAADTSEQIATDPDTATGDPATGTGEALENTENTNGDTTGDETAVDTADTQLVEAVVTEAPVVEADVGSGPVWIPEAAHRHYGELNDLIEQAIINNVPIYLCSTGVLEITGYTVDELKTVAFGMDTEALGDFCEGKTVIVSVIDPSRATRDNTVFIWIGRASDVPSAAEALADEVEITDDDSALLESEVEVTAENYTADAACTPHLYPDCLSGPHRGHGLCGDRRRCGGAGY